MVIESRTVVGGIAALAMVGVGLWVSTSMLSPPAQHGTVEILPVQERAWAVEITEMSSENTASR
jgi:hypothetical protein